MTLTDFLLARIAEQERRAAADPMAEWGYGSAWLKADAEAKRRIVEGYLGHLRHIESRGSLPSDAIERDARVARVAVRHLAAVYADHPDYREEWRA